MLALWEYFWLWPGVTPSPYDCSTTVITLDPQLIPWDDDWTIQYPELDSIESLSIIYYSEDDARDETDEDFLFRLDDLVFDVDQISVIVEHQEDFDPLHEDVDFIFRLDDQVYDVDQIVTIIDHEELIHDDDDYIYRLDDLVFDTDQIVSIADTQIDDISIDPEDDWIYRLEDFPTVVDTGELIANIYDYLDDESFVWPDEDSWDFPYGQFDPPPLPLVAPLYMAGLFGGMSLFSHHGHVQPSDAD